MRRGLLTGLSLLVAACALGVVAEARAASAPPSDAATTATPPKTPRQEALLEMLTPEFLAAWDVDAGLDHFVPRPAGAGNAAEYIKKLESSYARDKNPGEATVPSTASGLIDFVRAGQTAECRLTPDVFPAVVAGDSVQPEILVLLAYTRAALQRAEELARDGRSQEAEIIFRATLSVGRHLTTRSPSLIVYIAGLSCNDRAATKYARFLRDHLRHDESRVVEEYLRGLRDRRRWLAAKAQLCLGEFQNFNSLFSAAKIALEDRTLFWRQEAVIRLGVLRWGAPNAFRSESGGPIYMEHDPALQAFAERTLMEVARNDPEPSIRELAVWSFQHLTPERYVELRHQALVVKGGADGEP